MATTPVVWTMILHLASVSLYLAHMLLVLTAVYRRSHLNRGGDKTQYGPLDDL